MKAICTLLVAMAAAGVGAGSATGTSLFHRTK